MDIQNKNRYIIAATLLIVGTASFFAGMRYQASIVASISSGGVLTPPKSPEGSSVKGQLFKTTTSAPTKSSTGWLPPPPPPGR